MLFYISKFTFGALEYVLEIECLALPSWENLLLSTSLKRRYGTVVNVSCADGFVLSDGENYTVVECGNEGEWQPVVPRCECE